jgi:hypothetical protein
VALFIVLELSAFAQSPRFYARPFNVNEGDAVSFYYVESLTNASPASNSIPRANIASWQWDFDGDGNIDASGSGPEGMDAVWYATFDPTRKGADGIYRVKPRLYLTDTSNNSYALTNGVTEDVYGPPEQGVDPEIQITEYAAGNPLIKVTMSSAKRLAVTNETIRFFADVEFLQPGRIVGVDWNFYGLTNWTGPGTTNGNSVTFAYATPGTYSTAMRVRYTINTNATVEQEIVRLKTDFIRVVNIAPKLALGRAYRRGFPEQYDWDDLVKTYSAQGANGDTYTYFHVFEERYAQVLNEMGARGARVPNAQQQLELAELVNELLQGQLLIGNQRLMTALRIKYPRITNPDDAEERLPVPPGVRDETAAIDLALLDYQAALYHIFNIIQEFGIGFLRSRAAEGREPFPEFPRYITMVDPSLSQKPIPIRNEFWQLTSALDRLAQGTTEKAKKLFRLSIQEPLARQEAKEECKRAGLQGYLGMALLAAGQDSTNFALNEGNSLLANIKNARDLFDGINAGLNPLGNDGSFIPNESFGAILQDATEAVADAREAEINARNEKREFDQRQSTLRSELLSQRTSYITPLNLLTGVDPALYNNLQTVQDQNDYRLTVNNRISAILRDYPNTTASGAGTIGEAVLGVLDAGLGVQKSRNDINNLFKKIDLKRWSNRRVDSIIGSTSQQLETLDLLIGLQEGLIATEAGFSFSPFAAVAGVTKGILSSSQRSLQTLQTLQIKSIELEAEIRGMLLEEGNLGIALQSSRNNLDQARIRLENLQSQMDRLIEDLAHTRATAENLYFQDPSFRVVVSRAQRRAEAELDFAIDRLYRLAKTLEYEWTEPYRNPVVIPTSSFEPPSLENPLFDKFTDVDSLFITRTADEAKDYLDALKAWDSKLRRINITSVRGPNRAGPYSAEPISVREQILNLKPLTNVLTLAQSVQSFRDFLQASRTNTAVNPVNLPLEFKFQTTIEDNRFFPALGAEWNMRINTIRIDLVADSGFNSSQVAEVDLTQSGIATLRRFFAEPPAADDLMKLTFNAGRIDRSAFTIKVPARINGATGGRPPAEFEVPGLANRPVASTDWILKIDTTKPSNRNIDFSKLKDIIIRFTYTYGNPPEFPNF